MMKRTLIAFILLSLVVAIMPAPTPTEAATIVVSPTTLNGWVSGLESGANGSATFVAGPGTPPAGTGSIELMVGDSPTGVAIGESTGRYLGLPLASLTTLSYSTYRVSGGSALAIALQFNVDYDSTDASLGWQSRLVFEPYHSETVNTGVWQTWDTLTQGRWWSAGTPIVGDAAQAQVCTMGAPCTWAAVMTAYPNIVVHSTLGAVLLKAGSGWGTGFQGNADNLSIIGGAFDDQWDFEPDINLAANAVCNANNLEVTISAGNSPFDITGTGPGLPMNGVTLGTFPLTGPAIWQNVTVTETTADAETTNLGDFNCGIQGVTIMESGGTTDVNETGPTADTYDVVLDSSPNIGETVTITPTGFDTAQGVTVTPANRTFDSTNWGTPQTFTVTAVDDLIAEANPHTDTIDHTVGTSGGVYAGILAGSVTANITDNDSAGITIVPGAIVTSENGTSASFDVVLNTQPTVDVDVDFTGVDATEGSLDITTVTFTNANWNTAVTVTATGLDDALTDGDITYTVTGTGSGDASYVGLTATVDITNIDNEAVGLNAVPGTLDIAEINQPPLLPTSFNVWLTSPPQAGEIVTVNMTYDATQLTLDTASLVYDDVNWNTPQPVNITAIADGIPEPNMVRNIDLLSVSSLGGGSPSDGLTAQVVVTIYDDGANIVGHVPNHGLIKIDNWQAQRLYQSPSHGVIRLSDMSELYIPQDYDGNGFDTYNVLDIRTYNGETWLALWMGNMNWGWVPYDTAMMSIIEPLDWDIQSEWTP